MLTRSAGRGILLAVLVVLPFNGAQAAEEAKYPNFKGQWNAINYRLGGQVIKYDPNKPWGRGQEAPLTPEYQKVLEDSMADQAKGDWEITRPPGACRAACRA